MSLKKLEKLEKLVKDFVVTIHRLQEENKQLIEEVKNLKNEMRTTCLKFDRAIENLKKMAKLENANQKMESDKSIIRTKIKGILTDLDQIDSI